MHRGAPSSSWHSAAQPSHPPSARLVHVEVHSPRFSPRTHLQPIHGHGVQAAPRPRAMDDRAVQRHLEGCPVVGQSAPLRPLRCAAAAPAASRLLLLLHTLSSCAPVLAGGRCWLGLVVGLQLGLVLRHFLLQRLPLRIREEACGGNAAGQEPPACGPGITGVAILQGSNPLWLDTHPLLVGKRPNDSASAHPYQRFSPSSTLGIPSNRNSQRQPSSPPAPCARLVGHACGAQRLRRGRHEPGQHAKQGQRHQGQQEPVCDEGAAAAAAAATAAV